MSLGGVDGANCLTVKHLDGESRPFTAAVITVGSLWMAALVWDRGFLDGEDGKYFFGKVEEDSISPIVVLLMASVLLFVWAIFDGVICFLTLTPNIRMDDLKTPHLNTPIMLFGFFGLLGMNLSSISLLYLGQTKFIEKKQEELFLSDPAHYFISACLVISLVVVDVLFVTTIHRPHVEYRRTEYVHPECSSEEPRSKAMHFVLHRCGGFIICSMDFFISDIIFPIGLGVCKGTMPLSKAMGKFCDPMKNQMCRAVSRFIRAEHSQPSRPPSLIPGGSFRSDAPQVSASGLPQPDTQNSEDTGSEDNAPSSALVTKLTAWSKRVLHDGATLIHTQTLRGFIDIMDTLAEDSESRSSSFRHSPWVLGGMLTTAILLVFFGLLSPAHVNDFVNRVYKPIRTCVAQHPENYRSVLGMLRIDVESKCFSGTESDSLTTVLGAGLTSCTNIKWSNPAIVLFNVYRAAVAELPEGCDTDEYNKLKKSTSAKLVVGLDNVIQHMAWSSLIGALVGVAFGFRTLLSVLQQYKRALIAAKERIHSGRSRSQYGSIIEMESPNERWRQARFFKVISFDHLQWPKTYPLHCTIYFIGALVSTVVLQFFVAFFLVTGILAVLGSFKDVFLLLLPYWGICMTSILSLFVEEFVLGFLWRNALADGYNIKYPYAWVLYLLVSSMIHLILGILRAIARLLGMILVAVLRLGRLDVNQYPIFRSMDTSETAFGAMVLMQYQVTQKKEAPVTNEQIVDDDTIDSIINVEHSQIAHLEHSLYDLMGKSPFDKEVEMHSKTQDLVIPDGIRGDEGCSRSGSASECTLQQRRVPLG